MKVFLGLTVLVTALGLSGCSSFGHKHGESCGCHSSEHKHDASHKCDCGGGCKDGECGLPAKK